MAEQIIRGRVGKSARNFAYGMLMQVTTLVLNFVVRTVFIKYLNIEYLGINGLFSNILTVLSLAELGFGTSMVYSMYKPLAQNDETKLQALMNLYKKVYSIIGLIVAMLGLSVIPLFDFIIKEAPDIKENLTLIYLLFLGNSVSSYYFAYKRSILNADQKSYICSQYRFGFIILKALLQILVLVLWGNFIAYLLIQIAATIGENIAISYYVNRHYPYLREKNSQKLDNSELTRIRKDVYALILSKISHVAINGTANIIITAVAGVIWVGLYSNYCMITGAVIMILSQIADAVRGSVGNFVATESQESHRVLFRRLDFMNFWLYGFATIALITLFNPFIEIWLGAQYTLNKACVIVIALNFMLEGFLNSLWIFRTTMGLFTQGKYRPVIAASINIILSIILGHKLGILGVLLGTTFSRLLVNTWYDPYIIFKHGLGLKPWKYYCEYISRVIIMAICCILLFVINTAISNIPKIPQFLIMMICTALIPNIVFYIIYHKKEECTYLTAQLQRLIHK